MWNHCRRKSNNLRYQRAGPYASGDLVSRFLPPDRTARHWTESFSKLRVFRGVQHSEVTYWEIALPG